MNQLERLVSSRLLTEGHEKEIQTEHPLKSQPVFETASQDHGHLRNISTLFIELLKLFSTSIAVRRKVPD